MKAGNENQRVSSHKDLSIRDFWILTKYGFTAVVVCGFVFVLPYGLLVFGLESGDSMSKWLRILILGVVAYFIVSNLSEFLTDLSRMFAELGQLTKGMSFTKRLILFLLFILYAFLCRNYPVAIFFISTLIIIPAGLTYDKYKKLLYEKSSSQDVVAE